MSATRPLVLAVVVLSALPGCEGCELLTGPEMQIRRAVRAIASAGIHEGDDALDLDIFVSAVRREGDRAVVFARVDVEGRYRGTKLKCICIERLHLERRGGGWVPKGPLLPRLEGVVDALEARHAAFEARDAKAYAALLSPEVEGGPEALLVRLQRIFSGEEVLRQEIEERVLRVEARRARVTESYRLEIEGDSGVRVQRGRAAYVLEPGPDGWRFSSGLL